jgi:hypothetical protein
MNLQYPDASLKIHGNRLSGKIPSEYRRLDGIKIDMLEGNMFYCSESRNELPANDPARAQYSCGSQIVDWTLTLWAFVLIVVMIALLRHTIIYHQIPVTLLSLSGAAKSLRSLVEKVKVHVSLYLGFTQHPMFTSPDLPVLFPRVAYFHRIYCHMRRLVVVVTAIVVCVLLPFYSIVFTKLATREERSVSVIYENQYVRMTCSCDTIL